MILSRCAFVCMLALNSHKGPANYTIFASMVSQLQTSIELVDGDNQNKANKAIMDKLRQLNGANYILESWKMASKMRIWLQEKRKIIANQVSSDIENN